MNLNFKQWLEVGGFTYGSMTYPADDHPPAGSEITTDPFLRTDDYPPVSSKKKKKKNRPKKIAKFGFDIDDDSDGIRKEILPNYFV